MSYKNVDTVMIVDACTVYVSDTFKCFTSINSFNSQNNVIGYYYYYQFHFKDEKTKAQG